MLKTTYNIKIHTMIDVFFYQGKINPFFLELLARKIILPEQILVYYLRDPEKNISDLISLNFLNFKKINEEEKNNIITLFKNNDINPDKDCYLTWNIDSFIMEGMNTFFLVHPYGINNLAFNSIKDLKEKNLVVFLDIDDGIYLKDPSKVSKKCILNKYLIDILKKLEKQNKSMKFYFMTSRKRYINDIKIQLLEALLPLKSNISSNPKFFSTYLILLNIIKELNEENIHEKFKEITEKLKSFPKDISGIDEFLSIFDDINDYICHYACEITVFHALKAHNIHITLDENSFRSVEKPELDSKAQRISKITASLDENYFSIFFDDDKGHIQEVCNAKSSLKNATEAPIAVKIILPKEIEEHNHNNFLHYCETLTKKASQNPYTFYGNETDNSATSPENSLTRYGPMQPIGPQ